MKNETREIKNTMFFLLAAGYGKRTQPLSLFKPKPAFPLQGTPLLHITLEQLEEKGFQRGFINLHHLPEQIKEITGDNRKLSIRYFYEETLSGSRIINRAAAEMEEFLFIINGDVFMDLDTIPIARMVRELDETGEEGFLILRPNRDPGYSSVITENKRFKGISRFRQDAPFMYTGAALFRKGVIEKIDHINFFNTLAANPFRLKTHVYQGPWLDIGSPGLYYQADRAYGSWLEKAGPQGNSLSKEVNICPDSRVSGCIIWENTSIENCRLMDCIITGNLTLSNLDYRDMVIYSTGGAIKAEKLGSRPGIL